MNEFIKAHKILIISSVYFLISMLFFGYRALYLDRQLIIADLQKINSYLRNEYNDLEEQYAVLTKDDNSSGFVIHSISDFLRHFNDIAKKNDIIIRKLTPDPQDRIKFSIEILVDYYKFLHFSSDMESLDVTITNLQVHPYSMGELDKDNKYKSLPQHVISFTITPRNDGKPLASERLVALKKMVELKDKRNPFQRFAFDAKQRIVNPSVDLTWIYRLTGIGKDQKGPYATIDRSDYYVGDMLDGNKKIDKVLADRVNLVEETPNGKQSYVMKFRSVPISKP
ncbi:conserved hypothetical protein [Gammaproteobacteria bacterium]